MTERTSFVLHHQHAEILDQLSDEECGKLLKALIAYSKYKRVPIFTSSLNMAFTIMRCQMDIDIGKYEVKCKKNSENVSKRWNEKKTNEYESIPVDTSYTNVYERIRTDTKNTYNDNDNNNDLINTPLTPQQGGESDPKTQTETANSGESLQVEKMAKEYEFSEKAPNTAYSKTRKSRKKVELSKEQTELFERFWSVWPNKVSKGQAEDAWGKLCPDTELLEKILVGVDRAKTYDKRFLTGYTPHPSTWLNSKGWLDELESKQDQVIPLSTEPKVNRFVNFTQRDINFDDLEKQEFEYLRSKPDSEGKP